VGPGEEEARAGGGGRGRGHGQGVRARRGEVHAWRGDCASFGPAEVSRCPGGWSGGAAVGMAQAVAGKLAAVLHSG
jgi:hypothetical protein